jgi:isoleucyl-tRNA synthetase
MPKVEVRKRCRAYAEKFVGVQRQEFKRLGVLGDWERPYLTMDFAYEAEEVRVLGRCIDAGLLYRGKKPVCGVRRARPRWRKRKSSTRTSSRRRCSSPIG